MRYVLIFLLALMAAAQQAQSPAAIKRKLRGAVFTPDDAPVSGARVDHSDTGSELRTDEGGGFEVETSAPAIVVRKAGFRSAFIDMRHRYEVRVVLRPLDPDHKAPACVKDASLISMNSADAIFRFPLLAGVEVKTERSAAKSEVRSYRIDSLPGAHVRHSLGAADDTGLPPDRDVWRSERYQEVSYLLDGSEVIDVLGERHDGTLWRYLGRPGESVSYSGLTPAAAGALDQLLDGMCQKLSPKASSPWLKSRGSRCERHGARCEASATHSMRAILQEPQRGRWPHAAATLWAAGVCARILRYSSLEMDRHRFLLAPRLRAQIPRRAAHGTLATGC